MLDQEIAQCLPDVPSPLVGGGAGGHETTVRLFPPASALVRALIDGRHYAFRGEPASSSQSLTLASATRIA